MGSRSPLEKFFGKNLKRETKVKYTPPPRFFAEVYVLKFLSVNFFKEIALIILTHDNVFLNRNIATQSSK